MHENVCVSTLRVYILFALNVIHSGLGLMTSDESECEAGEQSERVLLRQHKNHYEQMCVIFMEPLNFSLLPLKCSCVHVDCMQLIENKNQNDAPHVLIQKHKQNHPQIVRFLSIFFCSKSFFFSFFFIHLICVWLVPLVRAYLSDDPLMNW